MKKLFRNSLFHKGDEMEQSILFKSQRNAFLFLEFSLIIWTFYESYKVFAYHSRLNILLSLLATSGLIIQSVSQLIMTHNAVKGDEESPKASPLIRTFLLCLAVAAVTVAVMSIIVHSVIMS